MEIIIGHINTDMDSLASTLLAQKLYPEALMAFPGTLNKNVRDFVSLHKDALPIKRVSEIKIEDVHKLIIVDNRSSGRIGPFKELLNRTDVEIFVYDHHFGLNNDIKGHHEVVESVGATTTLIIEKIMQQGLTLTPFEATVAALGIYEDTGRFIFANTTVRDAQVLPFLLSVGAQLQTVSEFSGWSLNEEQRSLLATLLAEAEIIDLHGLRYIIAKAERNNFVEDLALITHRMGELYDTDAAAAIVSMGKHVYFVGRSYSSEIDVGKIAQALGGGGHIRAASAVIKDERLETVYQKVGRMLTEGHSICRTAKDVMSTPVKTIAPTSTIKEVSKILVRCGHSGLPVVEGMRIIGMISRRDVEKALQRKLSHAPVKGFMQTKVRYASPETAIRDLQKMMIEHDIGRLPIVDHEEITGIVSRSDVLRALHGTELVNRNRTIYCKGDTVDLPEAETVVGLLRMRGWVYEAVVEAGKLAAEMGMRAAVVGGYVRDLLLGFDGEDLDLSIEGDGLAYAQELGRRWQADMKVYGIFGTAVLTLPNGKKIDIATARTEYYEFPAALPTVHFSSLRQDLGRRDFTINALAVDITPDDFGRILDFFGGYADLKQGLIRILYSQSFFDDPTRMFRAVRFEQRYGFVLETQTEQLMRNSIDKEIYKQLSPERITRELVLIFKEKRCRRILKRLDNIGLWSLLYPDVELGNDVWQVLRRVQQVRHVVELYRKIDTPWLIIPMLLFYQLDQERKNACFATLKLTSRQQEKLDHTFLMYQQIQEKLQQKLLTRADIYELLHPLSGETIVFIATLLCRHKTPSQRILIYLRDLQGIRPLLDGNDIKQLGFKPGPVIGDILSSIQRKKLNSELLYKEDEIEYVKGLISQGKEFCGSV